MVTEQLMVLGIGSRGRGRSGVPAAPSPACLLAMHLKSVSVDSIQQGQNASSFIWSSSPSLGAPPSLLGHIPRAQECRDSRRGRVPCFHIPSAGTVTHPTLVL